MAALAAVFIGGNLIGGLAKAINDSTKGVNQACSQLSQAEDELKNSKKIYQQILANDIKVDDAIKQYQKSLSIKTSALRSTTDLYHDTWRKQQLTITAAICILILSLIIILIIKRTNLIGKISDLFK